MRESAGVDGSPADVPAISGWNLGSFGVQEKEAGEAAFETEGIDGWSVGVRVGLQLR